MKGTRKLHWFIQAFGGEVYKLVLFWGSFATTKLVSTCSETNCLLDVFANNLVHGVVMNFFGGVKILVGKCNIGTQDDAMFERRYIFKGPSFLVFIRQILGAYHWVVVWNILLFSSRKLGKMMLCEHIFQIGWSHQLEFTVFCSPTTKDYLGKGFAFKWATYAYLGNPATIGWNGGMVVSANEHTWSLWLRRPRLTIPLVRIKLVYHYKQMSECDMEGFQPNLSCISIQSYLHVQDIDREFSCTVYTQFWMQHWCYSQYLSHTRLNANMFTYVSVYSSIHDWCIWSLPTSFMLLSGHPCSHPAIWLSIVLGKL